MSQVLLDAAGRPRLPATLPGFHVGRPPRNKGRRYPADPPTIEEIVAVMRHAGNGLHGHRLRGLVVVLWRAGLRIHEALPLYEGEQRTDGKLRAGVEPWLDLDGVRVTELVRSEAPSHASLGGDVSHHTSLGVTSIYLQGIDSAEIIEAVHARRAPMIPVDASLRR